MRRQCARLFFPPTQIKRALVEAIQLLILVTWLSDQFIGGQKHQTLNAALL